jgi:hypothetical protein
VRNALILLAVVALLILVGGALNNGVVFDVDYVAGTARAVSLLWVAAVIAALVFVVGLIAAYLAQMAVFASRRKLEAELQTTYERLREAEALAARPAPAPAAAAEIVQPATVVVAAEAATVVAEEDATVVDTGEALKVQDTGEERTAATDTTAVAGAPLGGEATAVTMAVEGDTGRPEAGEAAQDDDAGDSPASAG